MQYPLNVMRITDSECVDNSSFSDKSMQMIYIHRVFQFLFLLINVSAYEAGQGYFVHCRPKQKNCLFALNLFMTGRVSRLDFSFCYFFLFF